MIKTFIKDLAGENTKEVSKIICDHPELYGELDIESALHSNFFGLYLEDKSLAGFFAVSDWGYGLNKVICYVYIYEKYRREGLFNKIVKWVKNKYTETTYITIGARFENKLANEIYSRKFDLYLVSQEDNGNWYMVLDRSKK